MLTSYYGKTSDAIPGGIAISRGVPRKSRYLRYFKLAPGPWFKSVNHDEYITRYGPQLAQLNPQHVWDDLHVLANGSEPILLCYEAPKDFCHRRLVAQWFKDTLGKTVDEGYIDKKGDRQVVPGWEVLQEQKNNPVIVTPRLQQLTLF